MPMANVPGMISGTPLLIVSGTPGVGSVADDTGLFAQLLTQCNTLFVGNKGETEDGFTLAGNLGRGKLSSGSDSKDKQLDGAIAALMVMQNTDIIRNTGFNSVIQAPNHELNNVDPLSGAMDTVKSNNTTSTNGELPLNQTIVFNQNPMDFDRVADTQRTDLQTGFALDPQIFSSVDSTSEPHLNDSGINLANIGKKASEKNTGLPDTDKTVSLTQIMTSQVNTPKTIDTNKQSIKQANTITGEGEGELAQLTINVLDTTPVNSNRTGVMNTFTPVKSDTQINQININQINGMSNDLNNRQFRNPVLRRYIASTVEASSLKDRSQTGMIGKNISQAEPVTNLREALSDLSASISRIIVTSLHTEDHVIVQPQNPYLTQNPDKVSNTDLETLRNNIVLLQNKVAGVEKSLNENPEFYANLDSESLENIVKSIKDTIGIAGSSPILTKLSSDKIANTLTAIQDVVQNTVPKSAYIQEYGSTAKSVQGIETKSDTSVKLTNGEKSNVSSPSEVSTQQPIERHNSILNINENNHKISADHTDNTGKVISIPIENASQTSVKAVVTKQDNENLDKDEASTVKTGSRTDTSINGAGVVSILTSADKTVVNTSHATGLSKQDQVEVIRQIVDQLSSSVKPAVHNNHITIQLNPGEWGSVKVEISVSPNHSANELIPVVAKLVTENVDVKNAIENNMGELKKALRTSGMQLEQSIVTVEKAFTVNVISESNSSSNQQSYHQYNQSSAWQNAQGGTYNNHTGSGDSYQGFNDRYARNGYLVQDTLVDEPAVLIMNNIASTHLDMRA